MSIGAPRYALPYNEDTFFVPSPVSESRHDQTVSVDTNLLLIFGLTLIVVMGVSSITPAFPKIMKVLDLSKSQVGMLITCFSLPGVIFALPMGMAADRIGRKKILVPSLMLFGISGAACAFTRDFSLLLGLRFLQGIGATAAGVLTPTILGDAYTGVRRTVAMSYNVGVLNIGTASYPILGGALAMFGWEYPFLLPLAAIPLGILILLLLKTPEPRNTMHMRDYIRGALVSINNRRALGMFFITLVTFIILYGSYITFFPLLVAGKFGASSLVIGLVMSVTSFATVLTTMKIGWFVRRFRERELMVAGFFCYAAAMVVFPLVPALWGLFIPTSIYGFGIGINSPSSQSILIGLAPEDTRAGFMSVNSMTLRIGQSLGPLIMGTIIGVWGIEGVFFGGAILSLAMIAVTIVILR